MNTNEHDVAMRLRLRISREGSEGSEGGEEQPVSFAFAFFAPFAVFARSFLLVAWNRFLVGEAVSRWQQAGGSVFTRVGPCSFVVEVNGFGSERILPTFLPGLCFPIASDWWRTP